ncbi:TPA: hypothetical protein MYR53_002204 [Escherichia coli]|nr:hypothetical protein [Escherichia coli]HDW2387502.1 hypothetical protein [Escherichia coli]
MPDKLLRVNDRIHVMASDVLSVRYIDNLNVSIQTSTGVYTLDIDFGATASDAMDSFICNVNKALQNRPFKGI